MAEDRMLSDEILLGLIKSNSGGGGGGTTNYNQLENKPQIGGVTLTGNKSASDLGLADSNTVNGILNGQSINSFGGVETALSGKQATLTAGEYINISAQNEIKVNRTPSNDVLTYKITTPEHPKVNIQKYENGELVSETEYKWNGTTQTWTIDDKFTLKAWRDLGYGANSWQVTLLVDSYEHDAGWQKTWDSMSGTHFDMDFDKVDVSMFKLIIKSEMDDALSTKTDTDMVAADFNAGTSYTAGNYCVQDGKLYRFKNNHSGAWSASDVEEVKIAGELSSIKSGLTNVADDVKLNTNDLTTPSRSKNILPITIDILKGFNTQGTWNGNTYTNNGTVYVVSTNSAGYVTKINVSGTPQGSINYFKLNDFIGDGTSYILSGCPYNGQTWSYAMFINFDSALWDKGDGVTFNNVGTGEISIRVAADYAMPSGGLDYYPMIRLASETDSTFAPYIPSVESRIEAVEAIVSSYTLTPATGVTLDRGSCIRTINTVTIDAVVTFTASKGKNNSIVSGMPAIGNNNIPMIAVVYSNGTSTVRHVRLYNDAIMASEDFASGGTIHIMGTYTII